MKETELDKLGKIFRAKLHDFEEAPMPDEWRAIEKHLPLRRIVPFRSVWHYVAAAVVASLLLISVAVYLYDYERNANFLVRDAEKKVEKENAAISESWKEMHPGQGESVTQLATNGLNADEPVKNSTSRYTKNISRSAGTELTAETKPEVASFTAPEDETSLFGIDGNMVASAQETADKPQHRVSSARSLDTSASTAIQDIPYGKKKAKGWGFGMGAGGLGVGSDNSINGFTRASTSSVDNRLLLMNTVAAYSESPKTDIHHNTPVSFGVSMSKQLNDRFALQTGLSYTMLSSDIKTNGIYHMESKQKLHYLGIPVSIVYKIAEWQKFVFYASAGVMGEINVSGKVKSELFYNKTKEISETSDHIRMKEPLFSVNTRVGVSYPLIRFVSAFAEGGAGYYFDNGSEIETVRSEKPFNASFQVGLRLGF